MTEVTIREDLKHLERRGVLTRVRGGAVVSRNGATEMPLERTSTTNRAEKMAIAANAASLVENGQTIIIDVGSTTTEMAKVLSAELSRVVVITNGLNIALLLEALPGISVIVTGGTLRPRQHSLVAPMGTLLLDRLRADVAYLGCNGVDAVRGFTNANIAEAEIKQTMVRSAEKVVFLADHEKIGAVASAFVGDISCADLLVTDTGADPSELASLRAEGLKIVTVDFIMPEAFSDEITVISETPIIDVASPTFNTRFEGEQIIDLPTRGNFYDMIAVTPGVTKSSEGSSSITAYGSDMKNNQWNIDGVNRTLPDGGYLAWSMNDEMVAEIQVLGTGATAEYGNMQGSAFNVVTKSGTNEFHGSAAFDYWNPNWVATNAESTEPDTPDDSRTYRLDRNDVLAMTLGGPILRDKLWFFVGAEWGRYLAFWPDVVELPESKEDSWSLYDAKITAQLGHNHRLTMTVSDHESLYPGLGSVWSAPETWSEWWEHNNMFSLDYSAILGQNIVLEARGGIWRGDTEDRPQNPTGEPLVGD